MKERIPERLHGTLKLVGENWDMCMEPVEGALEFYKLVKEKGYHTYVLSNACNRFYSYFPKYYDLKSFGGIVVSSDIKMIKPSPAIYEYMVYEEPIVLTQSVSVNVRVYKDGNVFMFVMASLIIALLVARTSVRGLARMAEVFGLSSTEKTQIYKFDIRNYDIKYLKNALLKSLLILLYFITI